MHSSGRDEILGTAYSDHDLVVSFEDAGVAEAEAILDDPQRLGRVVLPSRWGYSQGRGSACHRALSQSGGLVRNLSTSRAVTGDTELAAHFLDAFNVI